MNPIVPFTPGEGDVVAVALLAILAGVRDRVCDGDELIACPRCHAIVREPCRDSKGRRVRAHRTRLVSQCGCQQRARRTLRHSRSWQEVHPT